MIVNEHTEHTEHSEHTQMIFQFNIEFTKIVRSSRIRRIMWEWNFDSLESIVNEL